MASQFWLHRQALPTEQVYQVGMYAYLDESGKFHHATGFICLCGWLSNDTGWGKFRDEWQHLQLKYRIQRIHMTEFYTECLRRNWTREQADSVLTEFIDVIRNNVFCGFAVGLDGRYFRAKHENAGKKGVNPALFAVEQMLIAMQQACVMQIGPNSVPLIQLHFDEDGKDSIECYKLISQLRRKRPEIARLIGSITFADDKFFPALQAADILANLTNRYWRDILANGVDAPPPPMLERLLSPTEPGVAFMWPGEYWNAEKIDREWNRLKDVRY
jgi:hypothetical protein